jgi:putative membrane-bound dehydrogenase-like protein
MRLAFLKTCIALALTIFLWISVECVADEPRPTRALAGPLSAEESLRHFVLADDGLEIQLVAAEPQVIDPVAIRFDEDGRLWVVEMRDYPHGPKPGEQPLSRIKVLEDRDGDGRYETATTFADGLLFATGVQPWRSGVFVTLAGKVIYLKDTDGDGRADHEATWFTGFAQENSQLRANHPTLALDGMIYVAGGLRGGNIKSARDEAAKPLSISNRDFAFDPRGTAFDAVSGNGQYGLTFDDYGRRFVCMNARPVDHVVLDERYAARNPHAAIANTVEHLVPAERPVYPLVNQVTTAASHVGQFTAACGIHVHRGEGLGSAYRGNVFVCEPTGSLVHREILEPHGATFRARPGEKGRSFLASRDAWFRPVDLIGGPDGALYVADMYRAVIEHPDWVPPEDRKPPNLRDGDDRGRIYRIARHGRERQATPKLSQATNAELVKVLGDRTEGWWQDTIYRLLLERGDPAIGKFLRELKPKSAIAQIRVSWLLEHLDELDEEYLFDVMRAAKPSAQEHAIGLAEGGLESSERLRQKLYAAVRSDDQRIRFQAALGLGVTRVPEAAAALATLVHDGGSDPWFQAAILSSMRHHARSVLGHVIKQPPPDDESRRRLVEAIARTAVAEGGMPAFKAVVKELASDGGVDHLWLARRVLLGATAANTGSSRRPANLIAELVGSDESSARWIDRIIKECRAIALDEAAPWIDREEAIRLLVFDTDDPTLILLECFQGNGPIAIRSQALQAIARRGDATSWEKVLAELPGLSPQLRRSVLEFSVESETRAAALLSAIEKGEVEALHLDLVYVKRLRDHRSEEVRKLAKQLLPTRDDTLPAEVVNEYREAVAALAERGDSAAETTKRNQRARQIYDKHCAACHRLGTLGVEIGPNLSDSRLKRPEQLLEAILRPNDAIDANYVAYSATTDQGQVFTGVVAGESTGGITLRLANGKAVTLTRRQIESLESTGLSLMPTGIERTLDPEQMAELVWYLRNWRMNH